MAEINDFVVSLEKELTCTICEEIFTQPKQLHCLHSFCMKCIERWNEVCKNRSQRLTCPTCRSREDADVSKLRTSFYLDSLKQLLLVMKNKANNNPDDKDKLPDCVSCQQHIKLVAFCQQCQGLICTDCVNAHKKIKQLQHQVIMIIDFKQEHVNSYISNQVHCEEKFHTDQKLEYFCQTCHKCICAKCSNTTHSTHEKLSIEEKADKVKQVIDQSLHRVKQKKQKIVEELELSKQNMQRIENEIKTAKKKLGDFIQKQISLLKDHETVMTNTLAHILREQKTINTEEQNELNAVIQQLDAVNDQVKCLQDQNVNYLILQSQLPERCKELLQSKSVLSTKPAKRNTSVYFASNSQVTQSLQDIGKIVENVTDPFCCSVELHNEEIKCGFVNTLEIVTRTSKGDVCHTNVGSINVQIKDDDGKEIENKLVEKQPGKYRASYRAEKLSSYQLNVSIAGKAIITSPIMSRTIDTNTDLKPVKVFGDQNSFDCPRRISVNNSHQVAILDLEYPRIVMFDSDGKFLRQFGKKGTGNGQLYDPCGVIIYEDTIVICDNLDTKCGRIQEFSINGSYLRTLYTPVGVELLQMCTAGDNISVLKMSEIEDNEELLYLSITLLSQNSGQKIRDIFICTIENKDVILYFMAYNDNKYFLSFPVLDCIRVYSDHGDFLYEFGENGNKNGQFNDVTGIAIYNEELLIACDFSNNRLQILTHEGQFLKSFGKRFGQIKSVIRDPFDIAVTRDGKVFVLEIERKRISVWQ